MITNFKAGITTHQNSFSATNRSNRQAWLAYFYLVLVIKEVSIFLDMKSKFSPIFEKSCCIMSIYEITLLTPQT